MEFHSIFFLKQKLMCLICGILIIAYLVSIVNLVSGQNYSHVVIPTSYHLVNSSTIVTPVINFKTSNEYPIQSRDFSSMPTPHDEGPSDTNVEPFLSNSTILLQNSIMVGQKYGIIENHTIVYPSL